MLGEMDLRSDRPSVHPDGFRLSSSFPRQRWSQLSPSSYASPVVETAGPSHQANSSRYEPTLDESARAYRATALRQLNGNPKPLSRRPRQANTPRGRSSTLASQPVLVRTYSGDTNDTKGTSKMPSRRSFPFAGSSRTPEYRPQLPSDEDFSIEGILRAIEPNIRNTLDSIAEIYGRSKLSLANEYDSHIAPLGEIRAPPGGLVTVEEASPGREQLPDENVAVYDDENSLGDGQDHSPFSHYHYPENSRQNVIMAPSSGFDSENRVESLPTTREFATKSRSSGRALLGRNVESSTDDDIHDMITPAVVAEILVDAQANGLLPSESRTTRLDDQPFSDFDFGNRDREAPLSESSNASVLADLHALFSWLKRSSPDDESSQSFMSAEMQLRAMLERANQQSSSLHGS